MNLKKTFAIVSLAVAAIMPSAQGDNAYYAFTNYAGNPGGTGNADGTGPAARFNYPSGIVADNFGNVYIADTQNHTIRRMTLGGVVTTIAGAAGFSGSANGVGGAARFYAPTGIAIDTAGNLYVADYGNSMIRKLTLSGGVWTVTTLAGTAGMGGLVNGAGSKALFSNPFGIAVDSMTNIYVSDTGNQCIRRITASGIVTTFASNAVVFSTNGYGYTNAFFGSPQGIGVDYLGNVYVAEAGGYTATIPHQEVSRSILKINPDGVVTTFISSLPNTPSGLAVDSAGNIYVAYSGDGRVYEYNAFGSSEGEIGSDFYNPQGVAVDENGNVWVADTDDQVIQVINQPQDFDEQDVVAGQYQNADNDDGVGQNAYFNHPEGIAIDTANNTYVADTYNEEIRVINQFGLVTKLAGHSGDYDYEDGAGNDAVLYDPCGIIVDASGNVYVADLYNNRIQEISPSGKVTTFDLVSYPYLLAIDGAGNVYVENDDNYAINEISPQGVVTTPSYLQLDESSMNGMIFDSSGNFYAAYNNHVYKLPPGGTPTQLDTNNANGIAFNSPQQLALDASGNVYVADEGNSRICMIVNSAGATNAGYTTNLVGGTSGLRNGTNTFAEFSGLYGVAVDSATNIYVADYNNNLIRLVTNTPGTTNWVVTILAGATNSGGAGISGSANGIGTNAEFEGPYLLALDNSNNLYDTDYNDGTVRKIALSTASVTTIAGTAGVTGDQTYFDDPSDVAVDPSGNVYVADTGNNRIRKINPYGTVSTFAGTGQLGSQDGSTNSATFYSPESVAAATNGTVYVADTYNHTIRMISNGVVSTVAGTAGKSGTNDGAGLGSAPGLSGALFWAPGGVAVDLSNNVFVSDTYNDTIREITFATNGVATVTTIAGKAGVAGSASGIGNKAMFNHPAHIAVDTNENVYVADTYNQTIRKLTNSISGWVVTTVGGTAGVIGGGVVNGLNGVGTNGAEFDYPMGVAVDALGNLDVSDTGNNRISEDLIVYDPSWLGSSQATDSAPGGSSSSSSSSSSSGTTTTSGDSNIGFTKSSAMDVATNYNGLFYDAADGVTEETSGMLTGLEVKSTGHYTGTIKFKGESHAISGKFDTNSADPNFGTSTITNSHLVIMMDLVSSPGLMVGTVSSTTGSFVSALTAEPAASQTAGKYTMVIQPEAGVTGSGYGVIDNNAAGAANLTVWLPDGQSASESVHVAAGGDVPVFTVLYNGGGMLLGWINLEGNATLAGSDLPGLTWVHPVRNTGAFTTAFTNSCTPVISGWSNAAISTLTSLNSLVVAGTLNTNETLTVTATGKIKEGTANVGSISAATGVFNVKVGSGSEKTTGYGVILLNGGAPNSGYYLKGTNNGSVTLGQQ